MNPSDVSVVIPTLDEAANIAAAVGSALDAGATEIIIADGGSRDETISLAKQAGATQIVQSDPGRGIQLKRGAAAASGRFVLFLHADNRLTPDCLQQICQCGEPAWGAFRQNIDAAGLAYRLLEHGNALRVRVRKMPFGDQAVFVSREVLQQYGSFAEIPLMEDVELARRLRREARPVLLPGPVMVDARRWQHRGVIRQTLRNWCVQVAYALGTSPERLSRWYR